MVGLGQWFRKRTVVEEKTSDGLGLALDTIEALEDQLFTLRGSRMKYKNQAGTEVLRFLREDLPHFYHYSSSVKRSKDNRGTTYIRIKIEGWTGIRAQYRHPSPFDENFVVTTRI